MLVARDGAVKLLDFGIAKLLEPEGGDSDRTALTREGHGAMTPEYAAPEQLTGAPVTTATDVYALGVLLYVLLTGRHPGGEGVRSAAELVHTIVHTVPPRASDVAASRKLGRQLQGDLDNILAKALKKRPEERYSSVAALGDDLRRYLSHQPVTARPDSLSYRALRFAQRHRTALAALAAAALLVAGLVAFYTSRLAAERDRARRAAARAAKVSEVLLDLLTASDPFARGEKEPTVREVLDQGSDRIQKELAGEPELEASMLTVMGRVYQRLGAHDKARPMLERAVALGRAHALPPERFAESLNDLGVHLDLRGDYAGAAVLLEEALALRRRILGPEHPEVAVTLVELGRVYEDQARLDRAEPLFREALAIRRKVLGDVDAQTATSLSTLALLLRLKGDLAGAEALFRETLQLTVKTRGEDHANTATALANLALVIGDRGDPAAAEPLHKRGLAISRKALGDAHPDVAHKLSNLAACLREQGKLDEALAAAEESLRIARPALGQDNPLVARFTVSLARVHLARGDARRAEPLLRDALRIQRPAFGEGDWRTAVTKAVLGEALTALARYGDAEAMLLEAGSVLEGVGAQAREYRATRGRLVALYQAWGRPEKAQPYR